MPLESDNHFPVPARDCSRREFIAATVSTAGALSGLKLPAITTSATASPSLAFVCENLTKMPSWEILESGHFFSPLCHRLQMLMEPGRTLTSQDFGREFEQLFETIKFKRSGELTRVGDLLDKLTARTREIFVNFSDALRALSNQHRAGLKSGETSPAEDDSYCTSQEKLNLELKSKLDELGITDERVQYHLKWLCGRSEPGAHSSTTCSFDGNNRVVILSEQWDVPERLSMAQFLDLEIVRIQETSLRILDFGRCVLGDGPIDELRANAEMGKPPADVAELRRLESRESHRRKQEETVEIEHWLVTRYRAWYGTDLLPIEHLAPIAKPHSWLSGFDIPYPSEYQSK